MNQLQKELGPKGLVVVGVTNEAMSEVAADVTKSKMHHPILVTQGEDVEKWYGIAGFPSGILVDPDGNLAWIGDPRAMEDEQLTDLTSKLVMPPELPDTFKDINALFAARKFNKAQSAITKALVKTPDSPDLKAAQAFITKALTDAVAEAKAAADGKEYGKASKLYADITARFDGLPGSDAGKAGVDALKKQKEAADDLAAYAKFVDANAQFRKGDIDKALKAFASIAKKWPDTPTGKHASDLVANH